MEQLMTDGYTRYTAQSKIVEVIIPFSGFYESIHDEALSRETLDAVAYRLYETYSDELTGNYLEKAQNIAWSQPGAYWEKFRNNYSVEYAKEWCHQSGIKYDRFEEISSPRYYNYTTDRLFVWCDYKSLQHLRVKHRKEFISWAMKNIHSRDGFILYSEYHPEMWVKKPCKTWDPNMWSYFLDWYEETQFDDLAFLVYEELWSTGNASNCLPEELLDLKENEDE